MQRRILAHTDLEPSVLCFGGGSLCLPDGRETAFALLDLYRELGGNFIDTANVYGRWLPHPSNLSEQYIGAWLGSRACRHEMIIATKGAHPHLDSKSIGRMSPAELRNDLESSLTALGVDCIDLYWLHRDDPGVPVADILGVLDGFVREGKIRYYACSNWSLPRIQEAQEAARAGGLAGFVANQPRWSLAVVTAGSPDDPTLVAMDEATWQEHYRHQWPAIPYSAQANGYFQKLDRLGKDRIDPALRARFDNPTNDARYARLLQLGGELGTTLDELVLGYLLAQPFLVYPIIGASSPGQLRASMAAGSRSWPADLPDRLSQPCCLPPACREDPPSRDHNRTQKQYPSRY
ncbi:MAG: aldo/keto reductase [Bacillota bacterium]|nr:aldo/keto reductase [Bacillota bacterium]